MPLGSDPQAASQAALTNLCGTGPGRLGVLALPSSLDWGRVGLLADDLQQLAMYCMQLLPKALYRVLCVGGLWLGGCCLMTSCKGEKRSDRKEQQSEQS